MFKKFLLSQFLESNDELRFIKYASQKVDYDSIKHLYVHIPFCRNKCPYCPYFKEKYHPVLAKRLEDSLLCEIDLHAENLTGKNIESLYIGGGTPTLLNGTLSKVIGRLKQFCSIKKIAIETNPEDVNEALLSELEQMGCNLLSLGIQDFNQQNLSKIGRKYSVERALNCIDSARKRNFETLNIDLIFAYPEQSISQLNESLERAIESNVEQITMYPLFTFPYSTVGEFKTGKKVTLPNSFQRKKFYYHIYEKLLENGYEQISVWSFKKGSSTKYSSVTRDNYLGLGPSAATYTGKQFLFNSFSLEQYHKQIAEGKKPYSIMMNISKNLEKLFWLYWRLYETSIPIGDYEEKFNSDFKGDFKKLIFVMKMFGYTKDLNGSLHLNKRGVHYIHLLQNHFALNYVNQIWSTSTKVTIPKEIVLKC